MPQAGKLKEIVMEALSLERVANTGETLELVWADGLVQHITWSDLRRKCPCAVCQVEREKPTPVEPVKPANLLAVIDRAETLPIKPTSFRAVGNYAYAISFSDGHSSGIYSLSTLRQIGN